MNSFANPVTCDVVGIFFLSVNQLDSCQYFKVNKGLYEKYFIIIRYTGSIIDHISFILT